MVLKKVACAVIARSEVTRQSRFCLALLAMTLIGTSYHNTSQTLTKKAKERYVRAKVRKQNAKAPEQRGHRHCVPLLRRACLHELRSGRALLLFDLRGLRYKR